MPNCELSKKATYEVAEGLVAIERLKQLSRAVFGRLVVGCRGAGRD